MAQRKAQPRVDAIYGTDADETFLVGIEQEERIQVNGTATGNRISNDSGYPDDPLQALAEWTMLLLSHVNGRQGTGWNFVNGFTGRSLPGVIEDVTIVRRQGSKFQVEWSLTFRVGDGMMSSVDPAPPSVSPTTSPTVDGQSLHGIESVTTSKSQKVRVYKFALHPVEENGILAKTGAKRTFSIRGSVPGDESVRTNFDQTFRSAAGSDTIVEFVTPFPGETIDVMVADYESIREAGSTQIGNYNLNLIEGTTS